MAITVVRSKTIALLLGPEAVGLVSVIDQVVQLVAYLAAFSLPYAAVRFLSRAHSESDERFRSVYAAFLAAILLLASIGTCVGIAVAFLEPQWFGHDLAHLRGTLVIALLAIPGMLLGGFIPNVFAAAQRVRASAAMAVVTGVALAIAWIIGILSDGVRGMYIGSVIALSAIAVGALVYLRLALGLPFANRLGRTVAEFRANLEIFYVSAIFALGAVASSSSLLVVRQSVLAADGPAAAGLLQSVYAVALAISLVLNPTNGLFLTPIMNRNIAKSEKLRTAQEYQRRLAAILVVVALPLVLFPKTVLFILFSRQFTSAGEWMFLFVSAQVMLQFAGVYQAILIGFDDLWRYSASTCAGFAISALIAWLLVPSLGLMGAGIGLLAGASVTFGACLLLLKLRHGMDTTLKTKSLVIYSLLLVFAVGLVARRFPEWQVAAMAARAAVGLVALGGVWALISAEERASFTAILARWRKRA